MRDIIYECFLRICVQILYDPCNKKAFDNTAKHFFTLAVGGKRTLCGTNPGKMAGMSCLPSTGVTRKVLMSSLLATNRRSPRKETLVTEQADVGSVT